MNQQALPTSYEQTLQQFAGIITGQTTTELDVGFPFYPLTAMGMPLPGPDFVRTAEQMGDRDTVVTGAGGSRRLTSFGPYLHYLYRRALYDEQFQMHVELKGRQLAAQFIPGHLWGASTAVFGGGPQAADVMIIGKHPGLEEIQSRRNFVGPTSDVLHQAFYELGIPAEVVDSWYFTNVVKHGSLDPNLGSLPTAWIKNCLPLLHEELRLVRPKYILCLGSEASKTVLGGSQYGVNNMHGRVVDIEIPLHVNPNDAPVMHKVRVMACLHPAAVHRTPELEDQFRDQLRTFYYMTQGNEVGNEEHDVDHANIYTERELKATVDYILSLPNELNDRIAIDAEWHGEYPGEPGAYIRTIQFSFREKWARCIVLRNQGGSVACSPSIPRMIAQLVRLCKSTPNRRVRIGGHFLRADLPWLMHEGLDLRDEYAADVHDPRAGGWDTSLMHHAVNETARLKLEEVAMKLTTAPRYDVHLVAWRDKYCNQHKLKKEDLEGYGECPAEVLCPDRKRLGQMLPHYGCYDADVTFRIMVAHAKPGGLLDADRFGNECWTAYHRHHKASGAVLEMELCGFQLDSDRVDELTTVFMQASELLLADLRTKLNWPNFNHQSHPQCVAALFGDDYARKRDKETGQFMRIRPEGAVSLGLEPITSTGKRKKLWRDLVARREDLHNSPACDKEVLGTLGWRNPIARQLRDLKFLSQVVKTVLRKPNQDEESGEFERDDDGNFMYEKGLAGAKCADGRVRTHLLQTLETCRFASRRPNLQNISKRREDDYNRILNGEQYRGLFGGAELYRHPIRSILTVPPGYVAIEADIKGAELAVLAWQAQDPLMIDHVRRNNLPEDHPDFFGMHAQRACSAFQLSCPPTKDGLKNAGKKSLYVAAKNVNFGIPYGRSAEAISRQCAEEGATVSVEECQRMIDSYLSDYVCVAAYLERCQARSQQFHWMCGAYQSYRRIQTSQDRQVIGEQKRQFQNFGIQNGVAEAANEMLFNFVEYRKRFNPQELWYYLMLQIHDAIIVLSPIEHAHRVYHEVMDACMTTVPFWPRNLDGTLIEGITEPYKFAIDKEIFVHWGEHITEQDVRERGLPEWMLTA
jgi:uracil-DNA glycosylase family 4